MAQQLQPLTIAAPGFAGINTQDSPIGLDPSFASIADNCVIDQLGRVGARKGYETVTTNGASVLGTSKGIETIFEFTEYDGSITVFSAGNNKIFTGTTTLTDVTPSGTNITANNWKIVSLADNLFFYQIGHKPLLYDGSALVEAEDASNASGTQPQGNEVLAAFGRLWVADLTADKHTIYFSDLLHGRKWSGGSSGSLDVTSVWPTGYDEITSIAAHNDFLIIFGKRSILVYSGASVPATMTLADTIAGVGCIARDSVKNTGVDLVFLSEDGVRSFQRVVQEKSMPMRDISKNVRSELTSLVRIQNSPIKAHYSADEAFYLLSLETSEIVYCFDMRSALQDGSHRVTTWSVINPLCYALTTNGDTYIGKPTGIVKYSGYLDNAEKFQMRYFSNPVDFGNSSNLKFLKKFNLTIIGGQNTETALNWGYDYLTDYSKQSFNFGTSNLAEYGVAEYNEAAEYSSSIIIQTPKVNGSGSGSVVTFGIEAQINDAAFSIQKIDILALLGRLI